MAHFRSTPSHGYYYASKTELAEMPEIARRQSYEEDCEWSILVMALPRVAIQLFSRPGEAIKNATETCRDWYPEIYTQLKDDTMPPATPENSYVLAQRKFTQDNANNYVVICAFGDWYHEMYPGYVPPGMVGCEASLAGVHQFDNVKYFLVSKEKYDKRPEFGYVIQPDDQEWTTH